MVADAIEAKLETLPAAPGVYVFKGARESVLYVGKASSLRSRVRSYFQPGTSDVRAFIIRLETELEDIETFVTSSEKEAALLENQLIKEHQPRYNIKLRDDKSYLSLRLDPKRAWPRLEVVRRPRPDGALYFGPYDSASGARQTLRLVNRHFQLRTCTDREMKNRVRPCLQYQIKRCPGPCAVDVSTEAYAEQVHNVGLFLDGRHDELVADLEAKMKSAAESMNYERAALHRDQLRAVSRVQEEQRVSTVKDVDQDVMGLFRRADQAELAVLRVRSGKLIGVRTFALKDVSLPDDELLASFVHAYYAEGAVAPDELLLPMPVELMKGLAEWLSEGRARKVKALVPSRGPRRKLLAMAQENAEHAFGEKRRAEEDVEARLGQVKKRLRLPRLPRRIECVDVSHTGGDDTVAVVVSLSNGAPDKARYRSFHVRNVQGGDDYGAMREVLLRRFKRGHAGEEGWELPDLFVVDGGRGQLRMAQEALAELGVTGLPIAGLAKEKENVRGETLVDRVYLPGQKNAVELRSAPALAMLALARDEAHRASNAFRKKVGKKRRLRSELDDVKSVGPRTRNQLLKSLGPMRAILGATREELVAAGASKRQAEAIADAFGLPSASPDTTRAAEEEAVENAFEA